MNRRFYPRADLIRGGHFCVLLVGLLIFCSGLETGAKSLESNAKAATSCVAPPDGLVAWWRAEGDARDSVTQQVPERSKVTYQSGYTGNAFDFTSYDSTVKVSASKSLDVGAGSGLTIELWINPANVQGKTPLVEWNNGQGWGVHFWISDQPGQLFANIFDTDGLNHGIYSGLGVVRAKVWQHVALTYDKNGVATLFLNGVVMAQSDIGSYRPQTTYDLHFGTRPAGEGTEHYYIGLMDEIALYNRALSRTEIQSLYEAGQSGKCTGKASAAQPVAIAPDTPPGTITPTDGKASAATKVAATMAPFSGQCVDVLDGDTIRVKHGNDTRVVRLYAVDAPEDEQSFYEEAMAYTRRLLLGKTVKVFPMSIDDEHVVGSVFLGEVSVSSRLVQAGIAWWDRPRAPKETKLEAFELAARAAERGLWADPDAEPPWDFVEPTPAPSQWDLIVQQNWKRFPLLEPPVGPDGKPRFATLTLNRDPLIVSDTRYDGFRFKATGRKNEELVWAFLYPENSSGWQIMAASGGMNAFRRYKVAERSLFSGIDTLPPSSEDRVFFQTLASSSLTGGREYLIWFGFEDDRPATFALTFTFADIDRYAGVDTIAAALGLKMKAARK